MTRRPIVITQFDPRSRRFEPLPRQRSMGEVVGLMLACIGGLLMVLAGALLGRLL